MLVTEEKLQEAAKEWTESLGKYKQARTKFYDLVIAAHLAGWSVERIWQAQKYASRNDINRILASHRIGGSHE